MVVDVDDFDGSHDAVFDDVGLTTEIKKFVTKSIKKTFSIKMKDVGTSKIKIYVKVRIVLA